MLDESQGRRDRIRGDNFDATDLPTPMSSADEEGSDSPSRGGSCNSIVGGQRQENVGANIDLQAQNDDCLNEEVCASSTSDVYYYKNLFKIFVIGEK
ncbi:hypothetical protein [Wolbachia pipientis]|uniref:hypothetical protein n=1 Tax=Wolbachia pipientis TaxID=955 RepID=UPI0015FE2F54|nr:hypothetical protein [Wolbachia pipientis]